MLRFRKLPVKQKSFKSHDGTKNALLLKTKNKNRWGTFRKYPTGNSYITLGPELMQEKFGENICEIRGFIMCQVSLTSQTSHKTLLHRVKTIMGHNISFLKEKGRTITPLYCYFYR